MTVGRLSIALLWAGTLAAQTFIQIPGPGTPGAAAQQGIGADETQDDRQAGFRSSIPCSADSSRSAVTLPERTG